MSSKGKQRQPSPGEKEADDAQLSTYFAKVSAALARVDEEMTRWNNYKADYEALKQTLLDLPKETTRNVMVPIGNLAFMPGQLIHTNEVLVMLGDNWFVDRSAHQAAEIVDRRMVLVQENLDKLIEQQKQFREKSGIAPSLLGGQEYNEEGLPIVEIVEPYQSDEEMEVGHESKKIYKPDMMPEPKKSKEQQEKDAALLRRLEELEREDEERERRRAAGEDVTSDEDDEDDEEEEEEDDEDDDYDDYDSEDDFRPKNLDSDEEYPEAIYEDSEDEAQDKDLETDGSSSKQPGKKTVRFAADVKKGAPSKPRSPADLIRQMRARSSRSGNDSSNNGGSSHIVTLDNLEATFAGMSVEEKDEPTGLPKELHWDTLEKMALRDKTDISSADKGKQVVSSSAAPQPQEAHPQLPQKKQSLFKQSRQGVVGDIQESKRAETVVTSAPTPASPKKLSRFAQQRAQMAEASTATTSATRGGVSEVVVERGITEPTKPDQEAIIKQPAVTGFRDVIENTFTRPSQHVSSFSSSHHTEQESNEPGGTTTRRKKSLFRQLAQQTSTMPMEPEPAAPNESFVEVDEEPRPLGATGIPQVTSTSSPSRKSPLPRAGGAKIPEVGKAASSSTLPVRMIKPVENSELRDTRILKGGVVERGEVDPVDEDEVEEDMLMRQVVSEYQERRQAMIAKYGAFNREDIEQIWEQQVVLPPEVKEALQQAEAEEETKGTSSKAGGARQDLEEVEMSKDEEEHQEQQPTTPVIDPKTERPKKLSLFRAARLTGALAKE